MCGQSSQNIAQNLPIWKPTTHGQSSKNITQNRPFGSPLHVAKMLPKHRPKPAYSEAHYMWPVFQKHCPKLTVQKPTTCGQNASKTSLKTCLFGSPLHVASLPKTSPKTDCSEAHYVWLKRFQNVVQNRQFGSPLCVAKTLPKCCPKLPIWKLTMCDQAFKKPPPQNANLKAHYYYIVREEICAIKHH